MIITENNKPESPQVIAQNDDSDAHNDEIGENSGEDTGLAKAFSKDQEDKKPESTMVKGGTAKG